MKRKAIFLLYRVLQALASPVVLVYLLLRGIRNPRYFPTLGERLGSLPSAWQQTVAGSIWLHAVSVGEVLAALPLIAELKKRSPRTPIFVSTTTLAGRETANRRLVGVAEGVFYAPLDYVWAVRRVLRRLRPSVVVVVETEIWPNMFREVKRRGCSLILVNGRISDRALPRYRRFSALFSVVLELCDGIFAQTPEMAQRFIEVGATAGCVAAGGNLKYDFMPATVAADFSLQAFLDADANRPLWIGASTSADEDMEEEDAVLAAQQQLPGWRLIVAPRKPERFDRVAAMLAKTRLNWTRRTALGNPNADVLLLDSIGELSALFQHASVVFMGGTMAKCGGHNILEPATYGKPVITGPHMENFREIAAQFERESAVMTIDSGDRLAEAVVLAAAEPGLGDRARAAAEAQKGASARIATAVMAAYDSTYPCERAPQPAYAVLWFFAQLWSAGSAIDRRRKTDRAARLPVPVVSVGNITTGGTGKTPLTIELLKALHACNPGMLTRGHGRTSSGNVLFPDPGSNVSARVSGDEAQLCMREAQAPIGIGSDRYAVGLELLKVRPLKMLVLDDGFQHRQLHRDFDLVLIDALHPFGDGHLVPLGRLREPLAGLARADAFVITRADEAANTKAIETILRRFNPGAPVFRAQTVPWKWSTAAGTEFETDGFPAAGQRAIAFCGLGNPQAFWKTLRRIGIEPVACYDFDDHHKYSPAEIRRLAQHARDLGAELLLTTAKDAINMDPDFMSILGSVELYWLEIRTEIEGKDALVDLIRKRCSV